MAPRAPDQPMPALREPVRDGQLGCRARSKAAVEGTGRGHRIMLGDGVELYLARDKLRLLRISGRS
jgi:hypothetical protein